MSTPVALDTLDDTAIELVKAAITAQGATVGFYEDQAPANYDEKVILADLPYLVFMAGDEVSEGPMRMTGQASHERTFNLMHVGATRKQARAAGDLVYAALQGRRLDPTAFPGASTIRRTERSGTRVDDVYTGVGKVPLVFGTDSYRLVP